MLLLDTTAFCKDVAGGRAYALLLCYITPDFSILCTVISLRL